ncbi:Crp-like helix-turn-helix domain protein [Tepidimonas alkaliphilus]|uniref:Crp-like helix-turn-helix domain protein n=1 Tax=Tepidimonas alkaliphilus TaxID=2588942 RepID=A0A554W7U1_9BURK|nr:Crp/Fnr family transcriptional regulator [Tepidimonas alkaliphilus]TSE19639.1 Crp-like helix-turn-helix domain protein [Tepidimonas alkaliphilus]
MSPAAGCALCVMRAACALQPLLDDLRLTQALVRERRLTSGDAVMVQGQVAQQLATLKVGALMLRRNPGVGGPRTVAVLGAGYVLSLRALLAQRPGAHAVAMVPSRVCEVPLAPLRTLLQRSAPAARWLALQQLRVTETLADWAAVARLPDALSRVAAAVQLLQRELGTREVTLPPRDDWAQLCGCAPETTSRMLARLEQEGRLRRTGRGRVVWLGASLMSRSPG